MMVEAEAKATRDALTDVANRRSLNVRLAQLWRHEEISNFPIAIILIDIDYFKGFNDRYGHPAGDACLKRIAACLTVELRNGDDLAVRFGGEEFLLLLPKTELLDAIRVAERIRRAVETLGIPHEAAVGRQSVTVSLGVAVATAVTLSAAELVSAADTALYAAKRNGRNQVCPPLMRDRSFQIDKSGKMIVSLRS